MPSFLRCTMMIVGPVSATYNGSPWGGPPMTVIAADGHVTETQEQVTRYLEEPYRRRPTNKFFYPGDGWGRRGLGTRGELATTADAGPNATDRGARAAA